MKLKKIQIENFRSIEDTEPFEIDDLTCLVGKNEAGKTAILQALHAVRPYGEAKTTFDVTEEYPRRFVTRFDERHPSNEPRVVTTEWQLSDEAREVLVNEFGASAVTGDFVTVSKHYNFGGTRWSVPVDQKEALAHLAEVHELSDSEKAAIVGAKVSDAAVKLLEETADRTAPQQALLSYLNALRKKSIISKAIDLIDQHVPTFFYTSHWDRMSGQVAVTKLAQDEAQHSVAVEDRIFLDFLKLAGTSLEELRDASRFEALNAKCEAASNDITQQIFEYWTQNENLEVKVEISEGRPKDAPPFNSGAVVRARVWNSLHRASVPFSERSAGFVWFFSFLVQFTAMRRQTGNVVILLDEPGLTLHGKAQSDLLRYIEKELLPHHQVIYSTHSPFMVPTERLMSVRTVEDVVERPAKGKPLVRGTKVRSDLRTTDRDTLFPLQGALGYDITQSLFVGKNTLLVEGPSDILYMQALSDALKSRQREGLDPRWTLCPTGGIGNVRSFVSLFGGNSLNIAVLADRAKGDLKKIEDLRRSEILKSGRVLTVADFTEKEESDIEDLFEADVFVRLLNETYALTGANALTVKKLNEADNTTVRQVKRAEAAFRTMAAEVPEFDHFTPSAYLLRHVELLSGASAGVMATLKRAEALFKAFNGML